jgi:hypothetical protein
VQPKPGEAAAVAGGNENMSMQPFLDNEARDFRLRYYRLIGSTLSLAPGSWGNYCGETAQ